jgi:hypothetical protein
MLSAQNTSSQSPKLSFSTNTYISESIPYEHCDQCSGKKAQENARSHAKREAADVAKALKGQVEAKA